MIDVLILFGLCVFTAKRTQNHFLNFDHLSDDRFALVLPTEIQAPPHSVNLTVSVRICAVRRPTTMPTQTERTIAAHTLQQVYLAQLVAEAEAQLGDIGSDSEHSEFDDLLLSSSDSDSDDGESKSSSSSSSSSSEDEPIPTTSDILFDSMGHLYACRYQVDREEIVKDQTQLHILLHIHKLARPEIFQSYLRIDPNCFDDLLAVIWDDSVFHNNSNNPQMPVAEQLAITLYQFGHYGNAVSTMKIALWAGVGYSTISLVTNRVLQAICSDRFWKSALWWPSDNAKATAKNWVVEASCLDWEDGWLMVDGTLVPLHLRPGFFGNAFFDHKSNYSMNVQVHIYCTFKGVRLIYIRLSLHLTYALLTTVLDYLGASIMPLLGRKLAFQRSMETFLVKMNGYGQIQHTY